MTRESGAERIIRGHCVSLGRMKCGGYMGNSCCFAKKGHVSRWRGVVQHPLMWSGVFSPLNASQAYMHPSSSPPEYDQIYILARSWTNLLRFFFFSLQWNKFGFKHVSSVSIMQYTNSILYSEGPATKLRLKE